MMNTTNTSAEFLNEILAQFAKGGRVMVKSYTRPTVYGPKHAAMFRESKTPGDRGVRIGWPGRSSVYVTPEMLAFEKL